MNKKIKVLMVGLLPLNINDVQGGVVAVILNILDGFANRTEIQITHISFNNDIAESRKIVYSENIDILYIPFKSKYAILDYFINRKIVNSLIGEIQPDLIHIHEITPQIIRFLHLNKQNIIVTQHGIMRKDIQNATGFTDFLKKMFKAAVEHILYPIFKNVVFISDYNSRFYRGVPDYSTRIFNPVNKLFFEIETGKHIPDSILFIAALSRNKNLGLLLVAVGKLKDQGILFHVNVVGDFKDASYRNEIFGIIENFGLKNQITFYGWRTQKEISDMHSKSAILVLTSKQESMPMVIAEAISSGRVVVATDVGGIAEMFEDGKSGFLFPSNDSDALVLILKRLHSDSHFLAEISENAKSLALRQFHPDIIADELLEFYYQVLNKKKLLMS